jgi:hypothetical protein
MVSEDSAIFSMFFQEPPPPVVRPEPLQQQEVKVVVAVPATLDNPFTVDLEKAVKRTVEFLISKPRFPNPSTFPSMSSDDVLLEYVNRKKQTMNRETGQMKRCLDYFVPRIMKASSISKFEPFVATLDDEHKEVLKKLCKWWNAGKWEGVHLFYLWPFSECVRYGCNDPTDMSCSILEVHRRIIQLEEVLAKMTRYIHDVVAKKPAAALIPKKISEEAGLILTSGSGLFGAGRGFWNLNDKMLAARSLPEVGALNQSIKDSVDCVNYLRENRASAMSRSGIIAGDELLWGIRLLTLFVECKESLSNLSDKSAAMDVWGKIQSFDSDLKAVYISDLAPMLEYGDKLTQFCKTTFAVCKGYERFGNQHRVEFPKHISLAKLTTSGFQIVGPSGEGLVLGHMEVREQPVIIPFPLNSRGENVVETLSVRLEKFDAHILARDAKILDMLVALGINRDVRCDAIETMCSGSKEILRRFNKDSHKANLTFVLPPTASMTVAGYLPHEIYKNA